ncbi:hypothetical protein KIN20_005987 [Parelaphostrongylus tenuis]|uniref:Adenylate kinase n=1 Tax=Parelaphostrongylus tenuis TaxID=148309 RepID=A0AAD5MJQ2_PARTN|nr:hypothetical protein KIN20_005987 [Parelaphostrongylus tenuis]
MVEEVAPLDLVIELQVPKKVLIDRLSKQLVHKASGRTYNWISILQKLRERMI